MFIDCVNLPCIRISWSIIHVSIFYVCCTKLFIYLLKFLSHANNCQWSEISGSRAHVLWPARNPVMQLTTWRDRCLRVNRLLARIRCEVWRGKKYIGMKFRMTRRVWKMPKSSKRKQPRSQQLSSELNFVFCLILHCFSARFSLPPRKKHRQRFTNNQADAIACMHILRVRATKTLPLFQLRSLEFWYIYWFLIDFLLFYLVACYKLAPLWTWRV